MKTDIHFTTCHHTDVFCRPRSNDYGIEGFNITSWTSEEKLKIAITSLQSLIKFTKNIVDKKIAILDDGSNIENAKLWLSEIKSSKLVNEVYRFPHRGSSFGINEYYKVIEAEMPDLVCHFEDDHIYYNPYSISWWEECYNILKNNPDIGVITLRSGLPSEPSDPGFNGKWGPIGYRKSNGVVLGLYRSMGNAHHIMLRETYSKFFPLQGNTGGCEAFMNNRLAELGLLNAEIQIPVYAFHSHKWDADLPKNCTTSTLNQTGRGIEYGIRQMSLLQLEHKLIPCTLINEFGKEYIL